MQTEAKLCFSLPSQAGNNGKYLTTNGTIASWVSVTPGSATTIYNSDDHLTDNRTVDLYEYWLNFINGWVGIGTTPTQPLDVNGNINISDGSTYFIGGNRFLQGSPNSYTELYQSNGNDGFVMYNGGVYLGSYENYTIFQNYGNGMYYNSYNGTSALLLDDGRVTIFPQDNTAKLTIDHNTGTLDFNSNNSYFNLDGFNRRFRIGDWTYDWYGTSIDINDDPIAKTITYRALSGNMFIGAVNFADDIIDTIAATSANFNNRQLFNNSNIEVLDWGSSQLKDNSSTISLDWNNRNAKRSDNNITIDWQNCGLSNGFNQTLDWVNHYLYTDDSLVTLNWEDGWLHDGLTGALAMDWTDRRTMDTSGFDSMTWEDRFLLDTTGSVISIAWGSRDLYDSTINSTLNWESKQLFNLGQIRLDWGIQTTYDHSNNPSIDWNNRNLIEDSSGIITINWNSGALVTNTSSESANWFTYSMFDHTHNTSIDWNNRLLKSSSGEYILDWQNAIFKGVAQSPHTIFTPATGGTVSLINNNYNIINPSGAILALTVNFPSSPLDGDVVEGKFTKPVTTVTYTGGTVSDGVVSPVLGMYFKYVFDNASSTWY